MLNSERLYSSIKAENTFAVFFPRDFNAHCKLWWPGGDTTQDGTQIDDIFPRLGLPLIIPELTSFQPHKSASCIDLILTDQPDIIINSGTRASLDYYCHHQIVHCTVYIKITPPPPYQRKIWHYNRADSAAIKRSMENFSWRQHFSINNDPNWQVKTFTDTLLNIMSIFFLMKIKISFLVIHLG